MPKLIIIEGVDCSGKATQTKKLIEKFKKQRRQIKTYTFPRHGQKFFGLLVDKYLNNEFGDATKLDPHIASLFYACDRWEVKEMLNKWLKENKIVILDRYATSNMAHQASKIKDLKKRNQFLSWLNEMEFKIFKIPKPDLVLYLDLPISIVLDLMEKRSRQGKEYINNASKDGHESNKKYLIETRNAYLYLCKKYKYWKKIECVENQKLLTKDEISDKIWEKLKI